MLRKIIHIYTDLVEPVSIDEAYLDVTVARKGPPSATLIAELVRSDIREATGLTASAGVSYNRFLAKTASGMNKPDGLTVILPEDAGELLASLPVGRFHGIGPATTRRMQSLGIETGADLREMTERELVEAFGRVGRHYYRIVRGIDERAVSADRERKSLGAERTFDHDLTEIEDLEGRLRGIAADVMRRLGNASTTGRTVTLKIKYHDFTISTRSRTLPHDLRDEQELLATGIDLLVTPAPPSGAVRLLGLTVSNLRLPESERRVAQLMLEL